MSRRLPVPSVAVALVIALVALRTGAVFEGGHRPAAAIVAPLAAAALVAVLPTDLRYVRMALQALLVLLVTIVAVVGAGGDLPGDVGSALARGLSSNLASPWPVPSTGVTAGGVTAAVALAGAVAVELAAARRPGPVVLAPVVGLVGLLGVLTAPAGAPSAAYLVVIAAGVVAVLRVVEVDRRRHRVRGPATAGRAPQPSSAVLVPAVVVLISVAATAVVAAGATRWDPRDDVELASRSSSDISPLSRVDGWRRLQPAETMFRLEPGVGTDRPWRLVALTRYDGRSWMPSADYRPAGRQLRAVPDGAPLTTTRVVLEGLRMEWLPVPDGVVEVSEPVSIDAAVGGLLLDGTPPEGFSYEVTAAAVEPAATADEAPDPGEILEGTPVPPDLVQLAVEFTAGARSDYERALLLAARLRRDFELDIDAAGGHSLIILDSFLERQRPGREEQFVAAYALLAAAVDLPVRVVVGFETEPADGSFVARSSGVRAWPEVEFVGAGWIPFDPVPEDSSSAASGAGDDVAAPADAEPLPGPQTPETTPPTTAPPPVDGGDLNDDGRVFAASPATIGSGLAVLAIAGYLAGVTWLKRRRRDRRRRGDPHVQVTGAFSSGVETLVDLGAPARRSATNRELVAAAAPAARGEVAPLAELADLATAAVFAPRPPDEIEARLAWTQLEDFERRTAASVGRLRWARARLSPRSLRRRL